MTIAIIGTGNMAKGVNGGRNPGHWGGVKPGQSGLGGGRSRSAPFDSAVASERPLLRGWWIRWFPD